MVKSWLILFTTFMKTSLLSFTSLTIALCCLSYTDLLEFDTQLYPMISLSFIIASIWAMIQSMRLLSLTYDLEPPANRALIPGRFLPSNHSRKAPPAVDV